MTEELTCLSCGQAAPADTCGHGTCEIPLCSVCADRCTSCDAVICLKHQTWMDGTVFCPDDVLDYVIRQVRNDAVTWGGGASHDPWDGYWGGGCSCSQNPGWW